MHAAAQLLAVLLLVSGSLALNCFSGLQVGELDALIVNRGAVAPCNGECFRASWLASGQKIRVMACDSISVCKWLGLTNNTEGGVDGSSLQGKCCDRTDNCNVEDLNTLPTQGPDQPDIPVHSCFSGIALNSLNNAPIGTSSNCTGYCANVTVGGVSIYSCDPVAVCTSYQLSNNCTNNEGGADITACCCDGTSGPDCNKPDYVGPTPIADLRCYVGAEIYSSGQSYSLGGGMVPCGGGECANVTAVYGTLIISVFSCDPFTLCDALNISYTCNKDTLAGGVTACCCGDSNACNYRDPTSVINSTFVQPTTVVQCFTGVGFNGRTPIGYEGECHGACARLSLGNATVYTCDPIEVCTALAYNNTCNFWGQTLMACCCNTDGCNDYGSDIPIVYPATAKPALQCFAGISISGTDFAIGDTLPCFGLCANVTLLYGDSRIPVNFYSCDPLDFCYALGLQFNTCQDGFGNGSMRTCCCGATDACNYGGTPVPTAGPSSAPHSPIVCYEGFYTSISGFVGNNAHCEGDCANFTLMADTNGAPLNTTLFMCDAISICDSLGIHDRCQDLNLTSLSAAAVRGCCCEMKGCNSPAPIAPPVKPDLECFVGYRIGATMNGGILKCPQPGLCANASITIGATGQLVLYTCDTLRLCDAIGAGIGCSESALDGAIYACCCGATDSCNIGSGIQLPTRDPNPPTPRSCFQGFSINDTIYGDSDQLCYGECASYTAMSMIGNTQVKVAFYTCDPVSVCDTANLHESCAPINIVGISSNVTMCCCFRDNCNNPVNPPPTFSPNRKCYVGVWIPGTTNYTTGAGVDCYGACANMSLTVGDSNQLVYVYTCDSFDVCRGLGLQQSCSNISMTSSVQGCCCADGDYCNKAVALPMPTPPAEIPPIMLCYEGIYISSVGLFGHYDVCYGQCGSMNVAGLVGGSQLNVSFYSCDPIGVCKDFGLQGVNGCANLPIVGTGANVSACCCKQDRCNTPEPQPSPPPPTVQCFVGFGFPRTSNALVGDRLQCMGQCGNITIMLGQSSMVIYSCDPVDLCNRLGIMNACAALSSIELNGCCCDSDYCNVNPAFTTPTPSTVVPDPIICYQGIGFTSGTVIGEPTICYGVCGQIRVQAQISKLNVNVTIYTCDPSSICGQLHVPMAGCGQISTPISGTNISQCCCDWNLCNNPDSVIPPQPTNNMCYVGVSVNRASIVNGGPVACIGECANVTFFAGASLTMLTIYTCDPIDICYSLGISGTCTDLTTNPQLNTYSCCCKGGNNCNNPNYTSPTGPPPALPTPIICYEGLTMNTIGFSRGHFDICYGDCGTLSLTGSMGGLPVNASFSTCDPVSMCQGFGVINNCGDTVIAGTNASLKSCCCNTDRCNAPGNDIPTPPSPQRMCYVGVAYNQVNNGGSVLCTGECMNSTLYLGASLARVTVFTCDPFDVCNNLGIVNGCNNLTPTSNTPTCCCNSADNCNYPGYVAPSPPTNLPTPILCYQGYSYLSYYNGRYDVCYGDCGVVILESSVDAVNASFSSCDPVSACQTANTMNNCSKTYVNGLDASITSCCCNTDRCNTPGLLYPQPTAIRCFAGFGVRSSVVGDVLTCVGQCANVTLSVGNAPFTFFMCDPLNLCNQLDINDRCSTSIPQLSGLQGCCCGSNTCNLDYSTTLPPPDNTTYTPMLCYVGVKIGSLDARTDLSVCYGVCASLTIMATIGDNTINATIYACETKSVCSNFGVQNRCQQVPATVLGANIFGCCCTDNLCNDPNGPPVVVTPSPSTSLQCYAGFTVLKGPNDYYTAGDTLQCNGQCANLTLAVGTSYFTFLMCDPYELCSRLGIVDRCSQSIPALSNLQGCCCGQDNCNLNAAIPTPAHLNATSRPLLCFTGVQIGTLSPVGEATVCYGVCASLTVTATIADSVINATVYACESRAVCDVFQVTNDCATLPASVLGSTVRGCCCNDHMCNDPSTGGVQPMITTLTPATSTTTSLPPATLHCYAGFTVKTGPTTYYTVGDTLLCNGQCSNLTLPVGATNVTFLMCDPFELCQLIGIVDRCSTTLTNLPGLQGCCCGQENCNLNAAITPPAHVNGTTKPTLCLTGIGLGNQKPIGEASVCYGVCASLNVLTTIGGIAINATVYACESRSVCDVFNVTNGCAQVPASVYGANVTGCCCDQDNMCNDPDYVAPTTTVAPPASLQCYAGFTVKTGPTNYYTVGDTLPCNGQCSNLTLPVGATNVTFLMCDPFELCQLIGMVDRCSTTLTNLPGLQGCCCGQDNCNLDAAITPPAHVNGTTKPTLCYTGVSVGNQKPIGEATVCYGVCASLNVLTTIGGSAINATVYACESRSVCDVFNVMNGCAQVPASVYGANVTGCCCNDDTMCNEPNHIYPTTTIATTTTTTQFAFGLRSSSLLLAFILGFLSFFRPV